MSYSVRLTDTAKQDLREIAFWIAEQAQDTQVAKQFVQELRCECNKLEAFPAAGAIPKDRVLKSMGYRYTVYKDYLVFYLINEDDKQVDIMAVFNAKRDYMKVMRKFI